jgi:Type II secretion system (T2SS), protein K
MRTRSGFALLSVLWFLTGVMSLAFASMLVARGALATISNRVALTRAEWRAEDCLARARAAVSIVMRGPTDQGPARIDARSANAFRREVLASPLISECPGAVTIEPFGAGLDLNHVGDAMLRRTLIAFGVPAITSDSLVDALLDWRDEDDSARTLGAERDWYSGRGATGPRNGPLADIEELGQVRGFEEWMGRTPSSGVASLFTTDSGRVLLDVAAAAVIRALPGLSPAAAAAVERDRVSRETRLPELLALGSVIPEPTRPDFERAFAELNDLVTTASEGWVLSARSSGVPEDPHARRLEVEIELRLVADGSRLAVVRRRVSP